jgi:hypothetical protein
MVVFFLRSDHTRSLSWIHGALFTCNLTHASVSVRPVSYLTRTPAVG